MKHLFASILAASSLVISACGTKVDLGSRPAYTTGTNTLTLYVYDGQSGAAITDATVTLRIGGAVETATQAAGAYTITGIPPGVFPITVSHDGYLTFTSSGVQFASNGTVTSPSTVPGTYVFSVGMFSQQSVTTDLTVKVYNQFDGAPITNGSVVAILDINDGIKGTIGAGAGIGNGNVEPLSGSIGFLPLSLTVPINAGVATLPHDKLVLGATYDIFVVSATNAKGQFVFSEGDTATAGKTTSNELVLFVNSDDITPVAVSANNEKDTAVVPTLNVSFPYPVETCSDASTWTWHQDTSGSTEEPPTTGAKVNISGSGTDSLVISPVIDPATVHAGDGVSMTFSNISVQVVGSNRCVGLGNVYLRNSSTRVSMSITQSVAP